MQIAIVDDMAEDRNEIQATVECYLSAHRLHATIQLYANAEDFLADYRPRRFDLLLLDLYMPGQSGMDVARQVRAQKDDCQLVFISSSDEFAVDGYEVGASNYLLKPLDSEALFRTLDRCLAKVAATARYIEVMCNRMPTRIPLSSILWLNTWQNAILFHTDGGEFKTYMTFQSLMELLESDRRFLTCYKGCLINMDRVKAVESDHFLMENGDRVQIRKRGGNQIKRDYVLYLCEDQENDAN